MGVELQDGISAIRRAADMRSGVERPNRDGPTAETSAQAMVLIYTLIQGHWFHLPFGPTSAERERPSIPNMNLAFISPGWTGSAFRTAIGIRMVL